MYEHLAEPQEEDVCEGQGDTDTDVPADSASLLLGRKGYSHDSQYESRERKRKSGVLLDKGKLHIRISSHLLDTDELLKLIVIERLHCLFVEIEVVDCQGKSGIDLLSASDVVGKVIVIVADKVFLKSPLSGLLIVYGCLG